MRFSNLLWISIILLGCNQRPHTSALQMDQNVSAQLDLLNFGPQLQLDVCLRTPMFVFVGDADEAYAGQLPGSIATAGRAPARIDLHDIVEFQVESLRNSLAESECGFVIETVRANGHLINPKASLVVITDGPQYGDSSIEVTHYGWNDENQWGPMPQYDTGRVGFDRWQIDANNQLALAEPHAQFEIHLPTQTEAVVRYFKDHSEDFSYDQFLYMFKAHGMRYASAAFDNDLVTEMAQMMPGGLTQNHAFLFDPHGPIEGKVYGAELYKPYWMPLDGCLALTSDARITPEFLAQNTGFCVCANTLRQNQRDLGAFAQCGQITGQSDDYFGDDIFNRGGLGGGKSLLYRSYEPIDPQAPVSVSNPNGINQIAAAVSYDMSEPAVEGISRWSLPAGKYPTLILLDSCYGSPLVGNLIEPAVGLRPDGAPRTNYVTTVTSNIQVANNITTYGALTASKYQLLALLPVWSKLGLAGDDEALADIIWRSTVRLQLYLSHEGLIDLKWVEQTLAEERAEGLDPSLESVMRRATVESNNPYRYFSLDVYPQ
jgi:hypothetical protein